MMDEDKKDPIYEIGRLIPDHMDKMRGILTIDSLRDAIDKITKSGGFKPNPIFMHPSVVNPVFASPDPITNNLIRNVTLLFRKQGDYEFTQEQLEDFLQASCNQLFSVDHLIDKLRNTHIDPVKWRGCVAIPKDIWIEDRGIMANIVAKTKREAGRMGQSDFENQEMIFGFEDTKVRHKKPGVKSRVKLPDHLLPKPNQPDYFKSLGKKPDYFRFDENIPDEMIADKQDDLIGQIIKKAAKAAVDRMDQDILDRFLGIRKEPVKIDATTASDIPHKVKVTLPLQQLGKRTLNDTIYTEPATDSFPWPDKLDHGSGSD